MKIIALEANKKRIELVAGLVWHPLEGTSSAKQVVAYAKDNQADLKVMRAGTYPHVGLASRAAGAKPGQLSAAAVIADAMAAEGHRSALIALPIPTEPDAFLYVVIRDTVILADGDTVGTAAEISEAVALHKTTPGWDLVVCPEDWGFLEATPRDFESFFSDSKLKDVKRFRLQEVQLDVKALAVKAVVLGAVAVAASYGWSTWHKQRVIAKAIAEAQLRQQAEQAERDRLASAVATSPPKPWVAAPAPRAFAHACVEAFEQVGTIAGNWKLDGAACEHGELRVRWVKAGPAAWVSHLLEVRPNAVVAADGLSATVAVPLQISGSGETGEQLQDAARLRLKYFDLASRYGMVLKVDVPQPPPVPKALPGQAPPPAPPAPAWAETAVSATAFFNPVEAASVLESPGLRFNKLVFSFTKEGRPMYQFSGVQYVRPL